MIEHVGDNAIVSVDDVAFTFETAESPRDFEKYHSPQETLDWTEQQYQVEDYRIFPYGANNDLPKTIKDTVLNNSIAPGIIKKKSQLIWGKGPQLYKEVIEDGTVVRKWQHDNDIEAWLSEWDYLDYISKVNHDFSHIESGFHMFHMAKGARIGENSIGKLSHISPKKARLATDLSDLKLVPKYVMVTDWNYKRLDAAKNFDVYGLMDFQKPFAYRTPIYYSSMYSFCSDYYTIPDIYGSLEWIRRSSAIPLILKALSKNSINLKYHVISPSQFWEDKRKQLQELAKGKGKQYKESQLVDFKTKFLREIGKVLSGEQNTGKFWHSIKYTEIMGVKLIESGWEIKEIKQNIKDFVSAQIDISDQANRAVAGGLGMHQALGGAGESGRADSGSEQLYALKNFLQTGIDIPEMIILKPINYALKLNFPNKKLKLGFYHIAPQREEDTSSKDRIKNNV